MPGLTERSRNNIRMGVFVSISLLLGLGIIVALTGVLETLRARTTSHTVRFTVQSGVSNLKSGSDVRVGGMRLGQVTRLLPRYIPGEPFEHIDVEFDLDRDVQLYQNASIMVSAPLIGAEAWLDITSVGNGAIASGLLQGSDRIGMLTALLGEQGAQDAQQMLADSKQFTQFLASIDGEYEREILPLLQNFHTASTDARDLVATVRQDNWPRWAASMDALMLWATQNTATLDAMLNDGHGLLTDSRELLAENRDDVRSTVTNLRASSDDWRELAHRLNAETIDRLHALLDSGQSGLAQAQEAIATLRRDYDGWATDVSETLGRANLASQQLNLTMTEVRRSPWKVLYRPSEKELEHELLYEAARSFAVAAADLKSASAAMQRVMTTHGDQLREDEALLERVSRNLIEPLDRYEIAQQRLLDVLFADR